MKILVVDDSGTMRKIEKMTLMKLGYKEIVEAENGVDGLNKLASENIDLIICDWNMPQMNGLQFVTNVRGKSEYSKIPIIMVTTVNTKDEIIAILKAGANGYISKPFKPDTLKEKIEKVLSCK